ncbi:unnamed protein product, partial [Polarella glacialis]
MLVPGPRPSVVRLLTNTPSLAGAAGAAGAAPQSQAVEKATRSFIHLRRSPAQVQPVEVQAAQTGALSVSAGVTLSERWSWRSASQGGEGAVSRASRFHQSPGHRAFSSEAGGSRRHFLRQEVDGEKGGESDVKEANDSSPSRRTEVATAQATDSKVRSTDARHSILKLKCVEDLFALLAAEPAIFENHVQTVCCLQQLGNLLTPGPKKGATGTVWSSSSQDRGGNVAGWNWGQLEKLLEAAAVHARAQQVDSRDLRTVLQALARLLPHLAGVSKQHRPHARATSSSIRVSASYRDRGDAVDAGVSSLLREGSPFTASAKPKRLLDFCCAGLSKRFQGGSLPGGANRYDVVEELVESTRTLARLGGSSVAGAGAGARRALFDSGLAAAAASRAAELGPLQLSKLAWSLAALDARTEAAPL